MKTVARPMSGRVASAIAGVQRWFHRSILSIRPFQSNHYRPLVLTALCLLLFCNGMTSRGLWASHEARAAQNAQVIVEDGNWLIPRLYDGQVELQKPPAYYWFVAAIGWLRGGVDAFAVRLPAVIAGLITVLLVYGHLAKRGRQVAGFIAAALVATAIHFTGTTRIGRIDVPLACLVAALALFGRECLAIGNGDRSSRAARLYVVMLGVLAGLALLLKGPIGLLLPVTMLAVVVVIERQSPKRFLFMAMLVGVVAMIVAAPWYYWINASTNGEFFRVFILHHHVGRAFGGADSLAGHPWWYYLPRFAADFLPWTPLLVISVVQRRWRGDADARFGVVWFAVMLIVLSASRFKRADYLLPAYAGAALFVGCAAERWYFGQTERLRRRVAMAFVATLAFMPAGWLMFDRVVTVQQEARRDVSAFAAAVRELGPQPVPIVLFRVESHQLTFLLGRPIHTLVEWGDLRALVRMPGPHWVVTRAEFEAELLGSAGAEPTMVLRSSDDNGIQPQRPLVLLRFD